MAWLSLTAGHMSRGDAIASGIRRRLSEQQSAVQKLRALAKPYRFRVQADAEGFPIIPGRYGQIEWHCDGVNCAALFGGFCPLPRQLALAVYTDRPRLFEKLWAIPGVKRHQTGDSEMRAVFPPDAVEEVAVVIKARRRRQLSSGGRPRAWGEDGVQSDFRRLGAEINGHRGQRVG